MSKIQKKRNDIIRNTLEYPYHINCIRVSTNTTEAHRNKIVEICLEAIKRGISFTTESKLKGGGRADCVLLDMGLIVEVTHTETIKSIETKKKTYPLPVVFIPAECKFTWKMLQ